MHVLHLPLRLGWRPRRVYAVLQDIVQERPGPDGEPVRCDTWDNATLHADAGFPLTLATKRIAPGESEHVAAARARDGRRRRVLDGQPEGGAPVRACATAARCGSASRPAASRRLRRSPGAIFEFGFSDAILQMWAAYLAEREGALGDRLGCVTPAEALAAHEVLAAAQVSGASGAAEPVTGDMTSSKRPGSVVPALCGR